MICPRCKGDNVSIANETDIETIHRGCLGWIGWILLAIITCGLILIIPLLTNSKTRSKHRVIAVCQNCGYRWYI